jgi:TonB family protein
MLRCAAALALTAGVPALGAAQPPPDPDFHVIRDWDADGSRAEPTGDTLRLMSGAIWSPKAYNDFVFRFDYRPLTPAGRGTLRLRATVIGRDVRSYEVALDHGPERGRLDGARQTLHELAFTRSQPIADIATWVSVEVRADQDRLTITLDGVPVATADRTEMFYGTIGFGTSRGGLELRGLQVAALRVPAGLDPALPRAGGPGVTVPTVVKQAYPSYSRAAMKARAQGVAKVEFVINADGSPGAVRVLEAPHPDLALAAIDCVRKWRFTAPLKDGVPAAIVATMDLSFKLK